MFRVLFACRCPRVLTSVCPSILRCISRHLPQVCRKGSDESAKLVTQLHLVSLHKTPLTLHLQTNQGYTVQPTQRAGHRPKSHPDGALPQRRRSIPSQKKERHRQPPSRPLPLPRHSVQFLRHVPVPFRHLAHLRVVTPRLGHAADRRLRRGQTV